MATNTQIKYTLKILNITPDPRNKGRIVIHLNVKDEGGEEWKRQVSIISPDRPLSLEEFKRGLTQAMLEQPRDPFQHLKEAIETGEEFTVEVGETENTPEWPTQEKTLP